MKLLVLFISVLAWSESNLCTATSHAELTVNFTQASYTVTEGGEAVSVCVKVTPALVGEAMVVVELMSSEGFSQDLTVDPTSTLTLTNTIIQVCWNVAAIDDTVFKNSESFTLTIVPMTAGVSVGQQSIVTVIDNDDVTVAMTEGQRSVTEGGTVLVCATLTGQLGRSVVVGLTITFGTASLSDFSLASGELTFTASDSSTNQECLVVIATSDDIFEDDETFTVTLHPDLPSGVTISGGSSTTVTIPANGGVIIQMTEIQKQVTEGGIVTVCASLTGQLGRNIEVRLATSSGGTDTDFVSASVTRTFTATDTTDKCIVIATNGDRIFEANEIFTVSLSVVSPTTGVTVVRSQTTVIIVDDDDKTLSSAGKKFVGFQRTDLYITNPESSAVYFTITPINISGNVSNSSTTVIPVEVFSVVNESRKIKGILVEADGNINLYGMSYHYHSLTDAADVYLALPCSKMVVDEYEYYGISYNTINSNTPSVILLVACENETVVKFHSSTITLNSMETYQIESDNDLTGTRITSSKPLSVFSGSDCANVPQGIGNCDHLVEQVPPTVTWGSKFLVASLEGRSSGERIRVLSARAASVAVNCNTVVSVSEFQLQSGGSFREFEIPINSFCSIESTSPVLVVQYAHGGDSDGGLGDPFMMIIPPMEQFTSNYFIEAFPLFVSNYVTVYVSSEFFQTAQILLDNSIVTGWRNVVCSSGEICGHISRTSVSTGAHSIRHQNSSAVLGVSVYGFSFGISYGYPGGMRLSPIQCNCGQNSICLNNMGQFNCRCLNGFVASLSETDKVLCNSMVQCEAEKDSVWGLVFPATMAGFSYSRQCPQNGNGITLGTATRFCTLGGVWEAVNIDNCTSEVISSLNDRANELFSRNASQNNTSQNEVEDLLTSLEEATSVNATGDSTIFPQDLSTTNTIVKSSVNYLVQSVEIASPMSSLNFSEEVMNVLNNVLDERNTEGWERLQEDSSAESQQLLLNAELYGQYVSLALRSEAVDTGNMTEIILERQNIVLAAIEVDTTSLDNITFPEVVEVSEETGSAQTVIPAALLMERGALEGNVTAVNILFSNLEDFLPKTNLEMNTTRPVSQVISSQVFSNVKLTNSQTQATFRFTTQKFPEDEVAENARCVFWSVSSDAANSAWSKEGVTTVSVDEDEQMRVYDIVCESSHFTAFAVLMDVTGALNNATTEIKFALSVVTYVGCSISIFFLLLSIFYFLTLRKELLTKVHNFIHLNLSISLLLGYVVFLSGVETAVANEVACVFVAALLHYLFTTVFFWMLCEGIMLYLMLVLVFNQISKKWWIFFIIGWVVPVIPVAISAGLIHDQYGTEEYCWIAVGAGDKGAIWAFVVPMLLVVLVNIFFLLAALRSVYNLRKSTMQRSEKKESLQLFSQLFKATIILLPLLGLTWVFGLLSVNNSTIVFAWLFSIFNSLQGLFVFIFHVLRSEKVTNFLKQCRNKMDSVVSTSASGKNNLSKNTTSDGVQLKPSHSRFSEHDHSTMQDEAIKVDKTAPESGSEKSAPESGSEKPAPESGSKKSAPESGSEKSAPESGSEKSYIAGLLENDKKWHEKTTTITFNWKKEFSRPHAGKP
ncbi:uncharacterized protein LOC135343205 isoform X2 [Halichondria panicea]|uniref:uncharacterized protein LOC135343205 isoform X2 n=1 Tax=Halichondria panicea TaxID=6063 RepID=UPI00312B5A4B